MDQLSFFEKFNQVSVSPQQRISEGDQFHCELLQKKYDQAWDQLRYFFKALSLVSESPESKAFEDSFKELKNNDYEESWHRDCYFCISETLSQIESFISKLNSKYCEKVIQYFESEYHLKLGDVHKKASDLLNNGTDGRISYKTMVELIIDSIGVFSLAETGFESLKKDFLKVLRYSEKVVLSKSKLSLHNFIFYDTFLGLKISYRDESLKSLISALSYFECKSLSPLSRIYSKLPDTYTKEVIIGEDYLFDFCDRISSVRFFLNGRIDIKFPNDELSKEFFDLFSLNTLPTREEWRAK